MVCDCEDDSIRPSFYTYHRASRSRCRDRLTIIAYGNQKEIPGAVIGWEHPTFAGVLDAVELVGLILIR